MTSITIPNSVTSIGDYAFAGFKQLKNVYCYAEKVPSTSASTFKKTDIGYSILHVPGSALSSYKTTSPWRGFGTIKPLDDEPANINTAKTRSVIIQSTGGFVTLSGLNTDEQVSFYATDGRELGTVKAIDGTAHFAAQSGTVVIAKIGKESVKIAVK